jgi:FkbH-like protein
MVTFDSFSLDDLLIKRKGLRRQLSAQTNLQDIRIGVLGGSTTNELVDFWEIGLLASGFRPSFYQCDYGRYYEEAVHDPERLISFQPDLVYIHTSCRDIQNFPSSGCSAIELQRHVDTELKRYRQIWSQLAQNLSCQLIQNNFELPPYAPLGNIDAVIHGGRANFILRMNLEFAEAANSNKKLLIQDVNGISARVGLDRWFDWERWFSYKILHSPEASFALARSLTSIVRALYGKSRKVMVLDLDNTLWGGVIGDDGVDKIQIGRETPLAEAYTAFQEYCLALRNCGVLLAVCSKNNEEIARQGFEHPDSVLKMEHISCFKANWEPKHENILAIGRELNLGVDSFVFVDDNPAERAIVEAQVEGIAVPDVGSEVSRFAGIIEAGRYFEPASLSQEDLERANLYAENAQRTSFERKFADYGEYLDSLEMSAEIDVFKPVYMERIAQLTNKTNQFNLTTRRYTLAEIEEIANDGRYIGLYGKLSDRFGDNGLISIVLGRKEGTVLHLDLWLMSCRVLKRDMEFAMLDAVAQRAKAAGIETLLGYYLPTKKNGMVADHYEKLGFEKIEAGSNGASEFALSLTEYSPNNRHINVMELIHG